MSPQIPDAIRNIPTQVRDGIWSGARFGARLLGVPMLLVTALVFAGGFVGLLTYYGPTALIWFAKSVGLTPPSVQSASKVMTFGVATFGGALVLTTLRDLQSLVPPIMRFFEEEIINREALAQAWWVLFVSFTGIFLGAVAVLVGEEKKAPPEIFAVLPAGENSTETKTIAFYAAPNVSFMRDDGALATFVVSFDDETQCVGPKPEQWTNVEPKGPFGEFLKALTTKLSHCADEGAPVVLEVRGFASSSEVDTPQKCDGAKDSDAANLKIAHARRDNVVKKLREGQPNDKIVQLIAVDWDDHSHMRRAGFHDLGASGSYSEERGLLNRRAEVRLVKSGGCRLRYPGGEPVIEKGTKQEALVDRHLVADAH